MNKNMTIGIIIVVFIAGFSIGYLFASYIIIPSSQNNDITSNPELLNQFSGTWVATETSAENDSMGNYLNYHWSFFTNESVHMIISHGNISISEKEIVNTWQHYSLRNDLLYITSPSGSELDYEYDFSSDKTELTLTRNGSPLTFTKS